MRTGWRIRTSAKGKLAAPLARSTVTRHSHSRLCSFTVSPKAAALSPAIKDTSVLGGKNNTAARQYSSVKAKMFVSNDYTPNDIAIPDSFLTGPPTTPPVARTIDWEATALPKNKGRVAFVVDNVLSREECAQLIALAEASVPVEGNASPWKPALISVGVGIEASAPGYRESDRIVWDQQEVASRVGERIMAAEGVREKLARFSRPDGTWKFSRVNERMRFLKYSKGQFFKRRFS